MEEATVKLLCPECSKHWQATVHDLPSSGETFHCPNCHASRRLAEFMHTDRDLEMVQQFE